MRGVQSNPSGFDRRRDAELGTGAMGAAEQALRPAEEVAGAEELPVEELRVEAVAAVSWVAAVS